MNEATGSGLANLRAKLAAGAEERRKGRSGAGVESGGTSGGSVLAAMQERLRERSGRRSAATEGTAEAGEKVTVVGGGDAGREVATKVAVARAVSPVALGSHSPRGGGVSVPAAFGAVAGACGSLALEMESGQAETPLAGYFSGMPAEPDGMWPDFALLGLTPAARGGALAWLAKLPAQVFGQAGGVLGCAVLEVRFQESGYELCAGREGEATSFSGIVEFAQALKERVSAETEYVILGVPGPRFLWGTRVFCVGELVALGERPALVSRIAACAPLLMVAGQALDGWTPELARAVGELSLGMERVLPVVLGGEGTQAGWVSGWEGGETGGWMEAVYVPGGAGQLEAAQVLPEVERVSLSRTQAKRRLEAGMELLGERQGKREREMRHRQGDSQRMQRQLEEQLKSSSAASRELLDELKQDLDEEAGAIQEWLRARQKRQFSPVGEATAFAGEITGELGELHLESVASVASRRFELAPCTVRAMEEEVLRRLEAECQSAAGEVRARLLGYASKVEERLGELHQHAVSIQLPELNGREIWKEIRSYCQMDVKMGIDLPKRDPVRMFMSGSRQLIMPIMVLMGGPLAAILAMFGLNRDLLTQNPWAVGVLVGLMFTGIVLVVKNARDLDREKKAQSVERMRETVRGKILREMEKVEKEKIDQIQAYLTGLKEEIQASLRRWVDEAVAASLRRLERESAKVRSAGAVLQKRVREVDQTRREVEALAQRVRSLG